jgi:hypothetical protein
MSKITRRDFINGTLMAVGSSMLPFRANIQAEIAALDPSYYPPARTGLRGSHPGSNDHAHSRAWTQRSDWGPTTNLPESYDLIVVGEGSVDCRLRIFISKSMVKISGCLSWTTTTTSADMPSAMNIPSMAIRVSSMAVHKHW